MSRLELLLYGQAPLQLPAELPAGFDAQFLAPVVRPTPDTAFNGAPDGLSERVMTAPHGLLLSARTDDANLWSLHECGADLLEQIATASAVVAAESGLPQALQVDVVDLFCLDARPLEAAVVRLRSRHPTALLWVGARPRGDGSLDIETFGLRKLDQREIHVPGVQPKHLEVVSRFLNNIAGYGCGTGATIKPGDSTSFGWVDVRHLAAEALEDYPDDPEACAPRFIRELVSSLPGVLVVAEPKADDDDTLQLGVRRATRVIEVMVGAARQCGLGPGVEVPRGQQTAVLCTNVSQGPPLEARRTVPDEPGASGWVAICRERDHNHEDAANFVVQPLQKLAEAVPQLFPMMAAPPETGLIIGADNAMTVLLPEGAQPPDAEGAN